MQLNDPRVHMNTSEDIPAIYQNPRISSLENINCWNVIFHRPIQCEALSIFRSVSRELTCLASIDAYIQSWPHF